MAKSQRKKPPNMSDDLDTDWDTVFVTGARMITRSRFGNRETQVALLTLADGPLRRPDGEIEKQYDLHPGTLKTWRQRRNLEYIHSRSSHEWLRAWVGGSRHLVALLDELTFYVSRIQKGIPPKESPPARMIETTETWIKVLKELQARAKEGSMFTANLYLPVPPWQ